MSNVYGVKIPSGGELTADLGDGIVFSTDTCNNGLGDARESTVIMEQLRSDVYHGSMFRDLDYWEYFLPDGDLDAPSLEEKHRGLNLDDNIEYFDFAQAAQMASEFSEQETGRRIAANPKVLFKDVKAVLETIGQGQSAALDLIGMTAGQMMCDNPKLEKGEGYNYDSIGLMLSPATMAGLGEMCPHRSWSCSQMCLNDAGQGETYGTGKGINWPQEFRKKRTLVFMKMRDEFWFFVVRAIVNEIKYIDKKMKGFQLCVRMNVLSDCKFEDSKVKTDPRNKGIKGADSIMEVDFGRKIEFYDYTKDFDRYVDWLKGDKRFTKNYHLTFSLSESNAAAALWVLENGGSVAVPFSTTSNRITTPVDKWTILPSWWSEHKVVDGDVSDMRFLDKTFFLDEKFTRGEIGQKGVITKQGIDEFREELDNGRGFVVGLRVKGRKNAENLKILRRREVEDGFEFGDLTGGFVQYADWCGMTDSRTYDHSKNMTNEPDFEASFVRYIVLLSEARRLIQGKLSHVESLKTRDFIAFRKFEPMIKSYIKTRFDMESDEIHDMAVKLANNLVRADDILFGLKYKPQRTRWSKELVGFLKQELNKP